MRVRVLPGGGLEQGLARALVGIVEDRRGLAVAVDRIERQEA
jgi:hypothetical protein